MQVYMKQASSSGVNMSISTQLQSITFTTEGKTESALNLNCQFCQWLIT
jgi:hypothetical protein